MAREYSFTVNDKKDLKYSDFPLNSWDIVCIFPKLKHLDIVNKDSRAYIQSGKIQMNAQPDLAAELISQGYNILYQVQG